MQDNSSKCHKHPDQRDKDYHKRRSKRQSLPMRERVKKPQSRRNPYSEQCQSWEHEVVEGPSQLHIVQHLHQHANAVVYRMCFGPAHIVPHANLARWVTLQLAEQLGIAANLDFPLMRGPARRNY